MASLLTTATMRSVSAGSGREDCAEISDGANSSSAPIDFVVIYKYRTGFLIGSVELESPGAGKAEAAPTPYDLAYRQQTQRASPPWLQPEGPFTASLGSITVDGTEMVVAFSVLNRGDHWLELLPPQIELSNPAASGKKTKHEESKKDKRILADQVPVSEYRLTESRLAPGTRCDGVLRFTRPDTKQYQENLELALATSDAINRPLILELPFTAPPANVARFRAQR